MSPSEHTQSGQSVKPGSSRRRILFGAAGGISLVALGAAGWIRSGSQRDLVTATLRRALPGITLDERSLAAFADDFLRDYHRGYRDRPLVDLFQDAKIQGSDALARVIGVDRLLRLPGYKSKTEIFQRQALTKFLLRSNFFYVTDVRAEPIVYTPQQPQAACTNPFANLTPPSQAQIRRANAI